MEILAGLAKSKEITASRLAKSTEITSSGLVKSLEIFPGRQYFPARRCYFPELDGISLLFSNQRCYFPKLIWYFPALCGDWFGVPKSNWGSKSGRFVIQKVSGLSFFSQNSMYFPATADATGLGNVKLYTLIRNRVIDLELSVSSSVAERSSQYFVCHME